ncbi:unnamed protein product [Miscanthus lutarioriparius]|uniref:Sialate O-acetylesterase domain-containing protein n=1 Tax=Miscanthus lutarioriparius TaxID=422564 RepID=A0A811S1C4_9POAL|nr:unnamed protein product [Miscanthus lutarioriparius]
MAQLLSALPMPVLLPFLLFLAAAGAGAGAEEAASASSPTLVFLLAGQSNMGGRGGATSGTWDGVVPPDCAPSPRILRLSPSLRWEEAREPLHAGIDLHNVLGGATPIANWSRGTPLYDRMLARARAALANGSTSLGALLWYQGEADTIRRQDADVYTSRMEAFVRDVRQDLGMPDLLVIQVGLATGQGKFVDIVREAQKRVSLHNVKYVDAKGLPVASDYTHLTTPAQVRLGKMLAASYLAATL